MIDSVAPLASLSNSTAPSCVLTTHTERYRLGHVADDALHSQVKTLVGRHNVITAELLAHLAEVDRRGIYRERACSSLYTYCIYELRLSEDEAQRRARAARTAREFPALLEMLADGAIHLTGLLLLAPHLTAENHAELLARARFRTKRGIERLVAEIAPRPDVPARIEPLGPRPTTVTNSWQTYVASLRGAVRDLDPGTALGQAPAAVFESQPFESWEHAEQACEGSERTEPVELSCAASPLDSTPLAPLRYRVQFTASQKYVDLLEEARDLLQHQVPDRDIARVHELAMAVFVEHLRKRRQAASDRPRRRATSDGPASEKSERATASSDEPAQESLNGATAASQRPAPARLSTAPDGPALARLTAVSESAPERPATAVNGPAPARLSTAPDGSAPERATTPRTRVAQGKRCVDGGEPDAPPNRHVPAAVRRAVWRREAGRCTFVDSSGQRCRERAGLELHHEHAFALGGPSTLENLRLMCRARRAHNALLAERDFGRAHVEHKRNAGIVW